MSGDGRGELIVGLDERQEGVLIGRRVVRINVSLYGSRSGLTSLHEFFDQLVSNQFRRRGRLNDLKEKFARRPSFFNPLSEFMRGWQTAWFMISSEVVLLVRIRWWRVIGAGGALQACIRAFKNMPNSSTYGTARFLQSLLFFLPHLGQRRKIFIVRLLRLETLQGFP